MLIHETMPFEPIAALSFAAPSAPPPMSAVSAEALLARIEALLRRFRLPSLDQDEDVETLREVAVLEAAGLGACTYLACLVGCVACGSEHGPVVAIGPWAGSSLLARCCASLGDVSSEEATAWAVLLAAGRGEAEGPRLLVGGDPEWLLPALAREVDGVAMERTPRGTLRLSIRPGAGIPSTPADHRAVEVLASSLLGVVRQAQVLVEECTGLWIDLRDIPARDPAVAAALHGWLPLLPEMPGWAVAAGDEAADDLWDRWRARVPEGRAGVAASWLACRARLAWCFAYLAEQAPAAGWSALLGWMEPASGAEAYAAARAAGFELLPADVNRAQSSWRPEGERALRCGLRAAGMPSRLATRLLEERRQGGPFESLFDLARRLPETVPSLLPLAAAGAFDELIPRGELLASWAAVQGWCEALASGTPTPEPPVLESVAAAPDWQVRLWGRVFAPGGPSMYDALPAEQGAALTSMPASAALLPARVGEGPSGETLRVAGLVLERRALRHDEHDLLAVALGDDQGRVTLLLPDAMGPPAKHGCWVEVEVVRGGSGVLIGTSLARPAVPRQVTVLVGRTGDRAADLERLVELQEALDAHPGPHPVQVWLQQGERRRTLESDPPWSVSWTPELRERLERVLGQGQAYLAAPES